MTCYEKRIETTFACAPRATLKVISELEAAGYQTYFVGGCVRDALSGIAPHDYDLTTAASPDDMINVLPYKHYDAGIKHGTVTFVVDDEQIEITMFRRETDYTDGRHPDSVERAASIIEDLARRDFTINAMAFSPVHGFIDPYGGKLDLELGIISCVGDPAERFSEDGLRVMRLMRFACCRGLKIEKETLESAISNAYMLRGIARERIGSELMKALAAEDPTKIADTLLCMKEVLFEAIPELRVIDDYEQESKYHDRDLLHHTLDTISGIKTCDSVLRLAALLHDCGKPSSATIDDNGDKRYYHHPEKSARIAERIAKSLRMSSHDMQRLVALVKLHDDRPKATKKSVRRFIKKCGGINAALELLELMHADIEAHAIPYNDASETDRCRELVLSEQAAGAIVSVSDLAINGTDLIESCGYEPGRTLGVELERLLDSVVDGQLMNSRSALIEAARRHQE